MKRQRFEFCATDASLRRTTFTSRAFCPGSANDQQNYCRLSSWFLRNRDSGMDQLPGLGSVRAASLKGRLAVGAGRTIVLNVSRQECLDEGSGGKLRHARHCDHRAVQSPLKHAPRNTPQETRPRNTAQETPPEAVGRVPLFSRASFFSRRYSHRIPYYNTSKFF